MTHPTPHRAVPNRTKAITSHTAPNFIPYWIGTFHSVPGDVLCRIIGTPRAVNYVTPSTAPNRSILNRVVPFHVLLPCLVSYIASCHPEPFDSQTSRTVPCCTTVPCPVYRRLPSRAVRFLNESYRSVLYSRALSHKSQAPQRYCFIPFPTCTARLTTSPYYRTVLPPIYYRAVFFPSRVVSNSTQFWPHQRKIAVTIYRGTMYHIPWYDRRQKLASAESLLVGATVDPSLPLPPQLPPRVPQVSRPPR